MVLISSVAPERLLVESNSSAKGWLKICGYINWIRNIILHNTRRSYCGFSI